LAGLSIFHIAALHQYGSTNPLGVNTQTSTVAFGYYYFSKDMVGFLYLALAFCILVFFYPELLGQLAVWVGNNPYYDIAICWKHLCFIMVNNNKVIIDQSAGNQINHITICFIF
jgi:quinol-cytochrome oxidoreductase complex cytochrome b subunit